MITVLKSSYPDQLFLIAATNSDIEISLSSNTNCFVIEIESITFGKPIRIPTAIKRALCGEMLFDYGVVVSIIEKDYDTYSRYANILPFYKNIAKEGVKIA